MYSLKLLKLLVLPFSLAFLVSCGGAGSKDDTSKKSDTAQKIIELYAQNGNNPPTVEDYTNAGITGINSENLKAINTIVESLKTEDVDTKQELQTLVNQLNSDQACKDNQHKESSACVNNTKNVACDESSIPENSTKISAQLTISWVNGSWSKPENCEWNCNSGYNKTSNICVTNGVNKEPIAEAGIDQTVVEGSKVTLMSSSTDEDGTITAWKWEEGGTTLSTKESFSKSDFSIGIHTIKLTVTDNNNATNTDSVTIVVSAKSADSISTTDASHFLNRSTFGPTKASIERLINTGSYKKWVASQFAKPATYHTPLVRSLSEKMCAFENDDGERRIDSWEIAYPRHQIWWETAVYGDDQLRQRVALALSEILVVSDSDGLGLSELQLGVTSYYDLLVKHAFGNYRDLLTDVTLHPAMGKFLSLTRNQKENTEEGIRPDENYAREVLQLFTIGVHELNIDGSEKLDGSGNAIPTYNQKIIEEFAKVFTGWGYSDIEWDGYFGEADHTKQLKAYEEYHDTSEKLLLNGAASPINKTAREDLDFALDNIFNHKNIAPFISAQLIQRLVTSNPSPAYIKRVATIFNNNGSGVKGDLKAVIKTILLDEEALSTEKSVSFGKLKEPLLRISHLWRNFPIQSVPQEGHYWESGKTCGQGKYQYYRFWNSLDSFAEKIGQGPLQAKSVFNFFRPDHSPNGLLNSKGLKAPEFQIINENTFVGITNLMSTMIMEFSQADGVSDEIYTASDDLSKIDLNEVTLIAKDSTDLVDHLNLVLLNNQMTTDLRKILLEHLNQSKVYPDGIDGQFVKAHEAILLITNSPEYLIQR